MDVDVQYGTGGARGDLAGRGLAAALASGYRSFDCAPRYRNQRELGFADALHTSMVDRRCVSITSKLWSTCHEPTLVRPACCASIAELLVGCEGSFLDLYLMHSPVALAFTGWDLDPFVPREGDTAGGLVCRGTTPLASTWRAMLQLRDDGLIKAAGVSNFSTSALDALDDDGECGDAAHRTTRPVCNHVELHPLLPQHVFTSQMKARGIVTVAFSPLGSPAKGKSNVLDLPVLQSIADRLCAEPCSDGSAGRRVTAAQVALAWNLRRGISVIPHSTVPAQIAENREALALVPLLTEADVRAIDQLTYNQPRCRTLRYDWLPFHEEDSLF